MHGIGLRQGVNSLAVAAGAEVDTQGFEGVCFFSTTGGTMQAQHGDESDGSDLANVGDTVTVAAGKALEIHKPKKRYVAATGGGALIAVLYGARQLPAMTGNSGTLVSPG
jgi:hypothetical protein